ncbi:BAHD acyltransferase At5g47980-like [Mercurialis annua]|uniref:BAHD acyltransferase At5g47980-like n=1 Tax=Mercurialis annua TaxID=3986 RepID=UPI0021608B86|nr:BAHD acyltransferase At5g47980-like [Mercurialis annua]
MEINLKISQKHTIKPSFPTPNHLRIFKLSLLDQLSHAAYGSMLLFYSVHKPVDVLERSHLLKKSFSEALTRFYPLAGRIKDNSVIECNDEGAVFIEAKADCFLSQALENPNNEMIRKFLPIENIKFSSEPEKSCLLLVQASFFACGGFAIGVCISHKIADASTVCTFIKGWAATASGLESLDDETFRPNFNASSIFPPQKLPSRLAMELNKENCATKRYVFDASKITALKAKAASQTVPHPTRVEAVTALIWKCATKAATVRLNSTQPKEFVLAQAVNIRKKMHRLSENTIGNMMGHFAVRAPDSQTNLASLVANIRKGMKDFDENYVTKLVQGNAFMAIMEALKEMGSLIHGSGNNTEFYIVSSLCKFPFYGIDFGWGKPSWVVPPMESFKNIVALIDSNDGDGIEAWVILKEEDMTIFERDQELLEFASSNPSVLINTIMPNSCL